MVYAADREFVRGGTAVGSLSSCRMTISIPDDILKQAGLTERDALIEFACRLFDADKLDLNTAGRLAGLQRVEFESELRARNLATVHYSVADYEQDRKTISELRAQKDRRDAGGTN